MQKRTAIVTAVSLSAFLSVVALGFDDGDFQYWTSAGAGLKLNEKWKVDFTEEFRFGNRAGNLYRHHSDLGFIYSGFADWLDVGFNYRLIFEKDDKTDLWYRENRPHGNVTFKWKMWNLALSNRNQFEYRDRENGKRLWRYRNRFTVKLPYKLTAWNLQPYFSDEVFISLDDEHFSCNRFYAGFSTAIAKNVDANIFYMRQSSRKAGDYTDYHVLGTSFKFKF